ncbi:MAG: Crp/Fnr family transcriptional regulator [Deltaproteobacteria bacterium]|nr:Crp/Fnr family transcriptional regulator [Deltaproteobacteria bacterium]
MTATPQVTRATLRSPIFDGVEGAIVDRLLGQSATRVMAADELVLDEQQEADRFFILHAGSVKVFYRSPEGVQVVVKLFRAPAVFGEMECLTEIRYVEAVHTLEKSIIVVVPKAALLEALRLSHALSLNLLKDVAARLCIAAQNERSLTFHPLETRLANLFLTYIEFYGLPAEDGILIRIPLTQTDLANAIGTVRRSITRVLQGWQRDGIVIRRQGRYVVRDSTKLARVSDPELLRIGYRLGVPLRPHGAADR